MKQICKPIILILAFFALNAYAGVELEKKFHDAYTTTSATSLQVANRFGSIVIENTSSNQITIDVSVKVEAASERKAQDILDRIDIIINKVGNTVSAYTEIENASWRGNVDLNIDYHIIMPAHIKTMLEMKYGKVDIDCLTGDFLGEVKYGDFKANRLINERGGINSLELAYCDGSSIAVMGRLNLEMAYSDCRIQRGEALNFEVKYSDLALGDIRMINGEMAYSDAEVEMTKNIAVEAKYSDLSVETVVESLEVEAKYSDVDVDRVETDFSLVRVDMAYGDIDVTIEPMAKYQMCVEVDYGDIKYPQMTIQKRDKDGASQYVSGYKGSTKTNAKVDIKARYGDISIR